jgi:hypothetical protein
LELGWRGEERIFAILDSCSGGLGSGLGCATALAGGPAPSGSLCCRRSIKIAGRVLAKMHFILTIVLEMFCFGLFIIFFCISHIPNVYRKHPLGLLIALELFSFFIMNKSYLK